MINAEAHAANCRMASGILLLIIIAHFEVYAQGYSRLVCVTRRFEALLSSRCSLPAGSNYAI